MDAKATLQGAIAIMSVDLVYYNPDQTKPIDCTYEIPVDPEIIISNVSIEVNDVVQENVSC